MVNEIEDKIAHELIDPLDFDHIVVDSFINGNPGTDTAAYHFFARSQMPGGTAAKNGLSTSFTEIAGFNPEKCTGCLKCISMCPDSAIKAKVIPESEIEFFVEEFKDGINDASIFNNQFADISIPSSTKGKESGKLIIAIDPYKCKGCNVCTDYCKEGAFSLIKKDDKNLESKTSLFGFFGTLPETEKDYISDKDILKISLSTESCLFTGGTKSCAGCMEQTVIKNLLNITGYQYGKENTGIVNALGCSMSYTSDYPFNPFMVPCINTGPDHAIAVARGLRARWGQIGWANKKLWVLTNERFWNNPANQEEISCKDTSGIKILVINRKPGSVNGTPKNTNKPESIKKIYYRNIRPEDPEIFYKEIWSANEFKGPVIIETDCYCREAV